MEAGDKLKTRAAMDLVHISANNSLSYLETMALNLEEMGKDYGAGEIMKCVATVKKWRDATNA